METTYLRHPRYLEVVVGSDGTVYRRCKQQLGEDHSCYVTYSPFGKSGKLALVHQMVLETFQGPPPTNYVGHHVDGNKRNNAIGNLQWVSRGWHTNHHVAKLTPKQVMKVVELRQKGLSYGRIGKVLDINKYTARSILRGESWGHLTGLPSEKVDSIHEQSFE